MASFADGKIQAFVGLPELGAADDLEQVIVEFIAGAKTRLDIAVQEIDSRAIAQAILDARWRGVRVTIFLDQDYLRSDLVGSPQAPNAHGGGESGGGVAAGAVAHRRDRLSGDREILAALLRSDIEVKGDYNPKIFHQKFILRELRRQSDPDLGVAVRVGQFHLDRHPQQPQQRLRLPQRLCLPPVPDRGRAAPAGQLRPGPARVGAQDL
jgi:hypothetical protein